MIYRKLRTRVCAIAGRTSLNAEDRCSSGGESLRGNEFVLCQSSGPVHPTIGRRSWREAQGRALGRARQLRSSLAQQRPSVAVEPLGAGARGKRLGPPPPPRLRPHAHAQLAVAAGRPPAGLVWGSAGTKWQQFGHLSCHCRKRARKTGAWAVGHFPAAFCARARARNGSHCFYAQGGDSWAAPLSLATRQAEQVGAR